MRNAETVVAELRARGELWEAAPGLTGLRGDALALFRALERRLAEVAGDDTDHPCDEWQPPAALALSALARADYFSQFPQWLTLAAHLREDAVALRGVAESKDPIAAARKACAEPEVALPPAVCYHVYSALADQCLDAPKCITMQGTCWRHEGAHLRPLARGWAFTMREGVCLGDATATAEFRARGIARAICFAEASGLDARLEEATDPFFTPTARGQQLLQRVKGLKQELLLRVGDERVAAASFNDHEQFFGKAFGIRLADGLPAHSACVAFGMERWLLAWLATHGVAPATWPSLPAVQALEVRA